MEDRQNGEPDVRMRRVCLRVGRCVVRDCVRKQSANFHVVSRPCFYVCVLQ